MYMDQNYLECILLSKADTRVSFKLEPKGTFFPPGNISFLGVEEK